MVKKEKKNKFEPKTYIATSAQALARINAPLLKNLERLADETGGELKIFELPGMYLPESRARLDPEVHPEVYPGLEGMTQARKREKLNENVLFSDIVVPPQNKDPSSGQAEYVQGDATSIVAHTKQRIKTFPYSNKDFPRLFMSTGAVTHPRYNIVNDRGNKAHKDHEYGAIIIEVLDDKRFNARNITALKNGKFVDLGTAYNGSSGKRNRNAILEAMVLGDIHVGDHDPIIMKANYEMIEELNPKRLFLHDLFNGHSINHHEANKLMTRINSFEERRGDLREELNHCYDELKTIAKAMRGREVNVVASNHNEFLDRYLEDFRVHGDISNAKATIKIANAMLEGENPLEFGLRTYGGEIPKNVNFLELDQDYKVLGYQLASHGHKGMGGGRGSMRSRKLSHGKSITGHTHSPEKFGDTYIVGTSTHRILDYTRGQPSSWLNTNALLWNLGGARSGTVQLVNIIDGVWKKD
jgi:hypothetical protein